MLIFLLVVIGIALLILGHEAGHFAAAKMFGLKVDEFGFGFPPRIFARRRGETEYSVNWLPFGGFVRITGESDPTLSKDEGSAGQATPEDKGRLFFTQPAWKKAVIVASGVLVNFILGWFMLSAVLMIGIPAALVVGGVQPGSPAEAAGIRENDLILGFSDSRKFIDFVDENRGKEITLNVGRGDEKLSLALVPRTDIRRGEGALGVLFFEGGEERRGFFAALWEGLKRSVYVSGAVVAALFGLVKNLLTRGSLLGGVVGPVGVFAAAYNAGGLGLVYLLQLIAMISLNLAVVNLVPFPALDGGRLLLFLVEKTKGSPLPRVAEAWINGIGFAFLVLLMILLTVRDVGGLL